jgi:putative membrane protein
MLEDQLIKAATGLAFIIPAILILRWWLNRSTGSPDEWAAYHIKILQQKHARGEIDELTYRTRLKELEDE